MRMLSKEINTLVCLFVDQTENLIIDFHNKLLSVSIFSYPTNFFLYYTEPFHILILNIPIT